MPPGGGELKRSRKYIHNLKSYHCSDNENISVERALV